MGATSVTGVGIGDSGGKYKSELHCGGCGCGSKEEIFEPPVEKIGCYITVKGDGITRLKLNNNSITIRSC